MTWPEPQLPLVGVIADDLTGANATGVLLSQSGLRTASLTDLRWPAGGLPQSDCVCINTESRALPPPLAYERVAYAARLILDSGGYPLAKRIDSTLRGNLGAELEAMLAALGPGALAVVTGAFPASGRTTVGGYHYVDGVLLAATSVRNDPLCPVTQSHVPTLLAAQTHLTTGELPLAEIRRGAGSVAESLRKQWAAGVRLVCADAQTDEDIAALGAGMVQSGLRCVAADPGPLTAAYVAAAFPRRRRRVLVVSGSASTVSHTQLDHLESDMGALLVAVDAHALTAGPTRARAEIERVTQALAALPPTAEVVGIRTGSILSRTDRQAAEAIAIGFAEITAQALQQLTNVGCLYTSGGDITLAVCRRLGAGAIQLCAEVMPLVVQGRLLSGSHPGLAIVTKGGLVGGADAAIISVRHILKEVV